MTPAGDTGRPPYGPRPGVQPGGEPRPDDPGTSPSPDPAGPPAGPADPPGHEPAAGTPGNRDRGDRERGDPQHGDRPATVPFGRSALPVTELGFGAATLGGLFAPMTDDEAHRVLEAAWSAGVRYFDTAPHYGVGLSEERLGRFLATKPRSAYVLSTKVGRLLEPYRGPAADVQGVADFHGTPARVRVRDYSRDGVLRSVDDSLRRLGLDRVDVLYVHDPDDHEEQALRETYPALAELRDQGLVRSVGVGMNQTRVPARFVRETDVDCLLIAGRYTLLDARAGSELLPLCAERGVHVAGAGVFNSGLLAHPEPGAPYDYRPAPADVLRRARAIAEVCAGYGVPLATAAIAFTLGHPAVRTVLVGMRDAEEVRRNTASLVTPVPAELWHELTDLGLLPEGAVLPCDTAAYDRGRPD